MTTNYRYACLICGLDNLTSQALTKHVSTQHHITIEDYSWKYLENLPSWPTCENPKCDKPTLFYKLVWSIQGKSVFKRCCSKSCARVVQHKNPDFVEFMKPIWKENGKKALPEISSNNHKYKKEHEGRTYYEDLLWSNARFQELGPVCQDTRFLITDSSGIRRGGYILDFSLPNYQIAIELDGDSHNRTKEQDKLRDDYLFREKHWNTLRIANKNIKENVEQVVDAIIEYIGVASLGMI